MMTLISLGITNVQLYQVWQLHKWVWDPSWLHNQPTGRTKQHLLLTFLQLQRINNFEDNDEISLTSYYSEVDDAIYLHASSTIIDDRINGQNPIGQVEENHTINDDKDETNVVANAH